MIFENPTYSKRTLAMLGFQDNSTTTVSSNSLKRPTRKRASTVKVIPSKMLEVNKTCFTNPWGLAGVSESELKMAIAERLKSESPTYLTPPVSFENPKATELRYYII